MIRVGKNRMVSVCVCVCRHTKAIKVKVLIDDEI